MSNADIPSFPDFGKLVPGFDFLQNLTKQAAASSTPSPAQLPNLGGWVAPTLNVEDLDKRIQELKAVQFWLDQNTTALKATIQALELQKMTLATLKGMNFSMAEVANAFKIKTPDSAADKPKTFAGFEIPASAFQAAKSSAASDTAPPAAAQPAKADAAPAAPGVVDPMQWWGALTQQFQTIAADAMKEAAKKSALDTEAVKKATDMATGLAKGMAESASKTVGGGARAAMDTALRGSQAWPTPVAAKTAARAPAKAAPKAPARKAAARKTTRKPGD